MPTFILAWNPSRWGWYELDQDAQQTRAGTRVRRILPIGIRSTMAPSDRFFMLKQRETAIGIVASGTVVEVTSEQSLASSKAPVSDVAASQLLVEFDTIENPRLRRPLGPNHFPTHLRDVVPWSTAVPEVLITDQAAAQIESLWRLHVSSPELDNFEIGGSYTRESIQKLLGLEPATGGIWFTGYHKYDGEWFLFPTVGGAGRTGHDYGNRWEGERLRWWSKTDTHIGQPGIRDLLSAGSRIRLFTRSDSREPFIYRGLVRPAEVAETIPVQVVWEPLTATPSPTIALLPEEVAQGTTYSEGQVRQVVINVRERSREAREACIRRWGVACTVCGLVMGERYGEVAQGLIHVHHLNPMAGVNVERQVDPGEDLRPVCPNCHAVIHRREPPLTIDEIRAFMRTGV